MQKRSETKQKNVCSVKRKDVHTVKKEEYIIERFIVLMAKLIENEIKTELLTYECDSRTTDECDSRTTEDVFNRLYEWLEALTKSAGLKFELNIVSTFGFKEVEIKYYAELDCIDFEYIEIDYILRQKGKKKILLLALLKAVKNIFGFNDISIFDEMYDEVYEDDPVTIDICRTDIKTINKYFGCLAKQKLSLNYNKSYFTKNFDTEEATILMDLYYSICSYYLGEEHTKVEKYYSELQPYGNYHTEEEARSEDRVIIGVENDHIKGIVESWITSTDAWVNPIEAKAYITEYTPDDKIVEMKHLTKKIRIYQAYESFKELLKRRKNSNLINRI